MRFLYVVGAMVSASLLTACGGGSGVAPVTPVVPVTPPPSNTDIADLTVSQTFNAIGNNQQAVFDLRNDTVASTSGNSAQLQVAYNASSNTYTLSLNGESATFRLSDLKSNSEGEARYEQRNADEVQLLTLVTTPHAGASSNRYVGMGYWQRYLLANNRQNDRFSTFVYGLETPASSAPRTGTARYDIDVFGMTAAPGLEPVVYQGQGSFDVDFLGGEFAAHSYLRETAVFTGQGVYGGGIEMAASGRISSGDGSFSGYVTVGSSKANTAGDISGRFFGPGSEEVGASFSASNAYGATAVGSFTGQRGGAAGVNLRMTDLVFPQRFYPNGRYLWIEKFLDTNAVRDVRQMPLTGNFDDRTNGNFIFSPGSSGMAGGSFTAADIVASDDPNFTQYRKIVGDQEVKLQLYKPGSANSELALTYVGLGRWASQVNHPISVEIQRHHFVYGLATANSMLTRRTGSARYEGVVYGAGANRTTGAIYDVGGTSNFNVNFGTQTYTGSLVLNGKATGQVLDFGRYEFSGGIFWNGNTGSIIEGSAEIGQINTRFYGPTGEELGGDFHIYAPERVQAGGLLISGVTAARRR